MGCKNKALWSFADFSITIFHRRQTLWASSNVCVPCFELLESLAGSMCKMYSNSSVVLKTASTAGSMTVCGENQAFVQEYMESESMSASNSRLQTRTQRVMSRCRIRKDDQVKNRVNGLKRLISFIKKLTSTWESIMAILAAEFRAYCSTTKVSYSNRAVALIEIGVFWVLQRLLQNELSRSQTWSWICTDKWPFILSWKSDVHSATSPQARGASTKTNGLGNTISTPAA